MDSSLHSDDSYLLDNSMDLMMMLSVEFVLLQPLYFAASKDRRGTWDWSCGNISVHNKWGSSMYREGYRSTLEWTMMWVCSEWREDYCCCWSCWIGRTVLWGMTSWLQILW